MPPTQPSLSEDLLPFEDFIKERQDQYDEAIQAVSDALEIQLEDGENRSEKVSIITQQKFLDKKGREATQRKIVIGVAGPGAVGKGTLMSYLSTHGYATNINVTTRPVRTNNGNPEQDGVEYFFKTSEQYREENEQGLYLTVTPRPGRGDYAISKKALEDAVGSSQKGCLVEENPETLAKLVDALKKEDPELHGIILYVLPPGVSTGREIIEVIERLKKRSGSNFGRDDIESTCGKRQMDELMSIASQIRRGIEVVFIENDDLDETKRRLDHLFL